MLDRTKSFQNCRETDVPGYNDCPSFVYPAKRGTGSKQTMVNGQIDTFGSTQAASAPPPPTIRKRTSSHNSSVCKVAPQETLCMDKDEILHEIDNLLARESKLPAAELEYHQKKFRANFGQVLEQDHGRQLMNEVLASLQDESKVHKILTQWMMSDSTVNKWCPSLRKILCNLQADGI
ncbi:LAFA_0G21704g1_1 [Lachancea sp. 'fantastica']|nr:LAFA_0G21704g1_1 [Lachancea sp. 'fantastica']